MPTLKLKADWSAICRSIVFKNILLFLLILLAVVLPLSLNYYADSRNYEIQNLASKLEFFAERGASYLDVEGIHSLRTPADKRYPEYRKMIETLTRIQNEFDVDNAIIMRREKNGRFVFIGAGETGGIGGGNSASNPCSLNASTNPCNTTLQRNPCTPSAAANPCSPGTGGRSRFDIGMPVDIHNIFPGTYKGTNDTWDSGIMMHSKLFGGNVGNREFDQFLQINAPLKLNSEVVAILMINKFANPVAKAVIEKTTRLVILTIGILIIGLGLFGGLSARMLRLLGTLTQAADEVSAGNLDVTIPEPRSRDEVGRLAISFRHMIDGLKQRDFIRNTFGRYVSQEVVDELLTSPDGLKLGGELREITLLVSDLRGFTAMSSNMKPHEVIEVMNNYLSHMIDIITRFGGTVDEFQGDGILAFFGAPIKIEKGPDRAVACAIEMQKAMGVVNEDQRRRNLPELQMGIGINTGEVIVGNLGSEKRTKYSAIGTTINTAYRIESYTIGAQILISSSTHAYIKDIVYVNGTIDVQFKGLEEPLSVFDVTGIQGEYASSIPEKAPETFAALSPAIVVNFFALEGKTVSEKFIQGKITHLSENLAKAEIGVEIEKLSSLKLHIDVTNSEEIFEAYAKVMDVLPLQNSEGQFQINLAFTSLPADLKKYLVQLRT
ncbi:MAG: adenylate/guanylate cyclase domain-containing protein [Nitrospinaceae bacterium]|jgi:class 3 adenylate cyclase|nr:adenylate/guanylate cyclase domain-containing protein [Nitrospinaceae bacterium]MBT3821287.1 adenylate/guanylate cyclase domain-containing protein [Nitrospinaceae bacterium]MBT4092631.1 adenylate/guanylate cyclase domain-containing protein [Nitrospinaceae bacterium]MBT4431067.1 adenylate/guanylate cyclase domain-containing protein [Nitrospinaceae bacterium]MBT5367012.1 adenylate/guanylate cyclase domain-containing protein [Nitrospinaceae bacterium]